MRPKLVADLLDLRRLRFERRCQGLNLRLLLPDGRSKLFPLLRDRLVLLCDGCLHLGNRYRLFLYLAMLFEKFVEQHRVHGVVADAVRLALVIASHKVGVYLLHLLGDEAKLWDASWIQLVFVAKGHWLQLKDCFACLVHWFDVVLKTLRGNDRAEMTVGIDDYPNASCHRGSADAGNIGGVVGFPRANPDGVGIRRQAAIADLDIIVSSLDMQSGEMAERNIVPAGGVIPQREGADRGIITRGGVVVERTDSKGAIASAGRIVIHRKYARGRVASAVIQIEALKADGCVAAATGVTVEGISPDRGVKAAGRVTVEG